MLFSAESVEPVPHYDVCMKHKNIFIIYDIHYEHACICSMPILKKNLHFTLFISSSLLHTYSVHQALTLQIKNRDTPKDEASQYLLLFIFFIVSCTDSHFLVLDVH